jgi:RimJ/RimL family protein N-acetyltransferase
VQLEDELAWISKAAAEPASRRFAILADEVYIGNTYLTGIEGEAAEFHIFIGDKSYWRKGVAREVTKQVIQYAWDELSLKRVCLGVHPDNKAAVRLYNSLGFIPEGIDGPFIRMSLDRSTASACRAVWM